jgi:hypothetical protein
MIALQVYLRGGGTLADLYEKYHLSTKRHHLFTNLVQFKYHQFESPFDQQIVRESRGIILDESKDWAIVSFPYTKFFNHGEALAAQIDWSTARAYEKLDGSLCTLYHYEGGWYVSTSGTPDANTPVNDNADTFSDLFWRTFNACKYSLDLLSPSCCYMFELMTPSNQIVVRHPVSRLVLHGWRDITTLKEGNPEDLSDSFTVVKSWPLRTLTEVIEAAAALNPMQHEGFVVCDAFFNRVKIKSPAYVALHRAKDGMSPRTVRNIVRTGEQWEFVQYFPELGLEVDAQKVKHEALVSRIEQEWSRLSTIKDRKTFALEAKLLPFSGVLFALFLGRTTSAREYLASAPESYYETLTAEAA